MKWTFSRRSVGVIPGFVAVALFAGSAGANPGAAAVSSTSPQRTSVQDTASITIRGRTFSRALLSAQHEARIRRFNGAMAEGTRLSASAALVGPSIVLADPRSATTSKKRPLAERSHLQALRHVPRDALDFCGATKAAACLYFPSDAYLFKIAGGFEDMDLQIVEPACSNMGGTIVSSNGEQPTYCSFVYPAKFVGNFVPASTTTDKPSFTEDCSRNDFSVTHDPNGVITISENGSSDFGPLSYPLTCVVRAFESEKFEPNTEQTLQIGTKGSIKHR